MRILEDIGAQNDLARAIVTRAALRQNAGDVNAARQLLGQAYAIYETLSTLGEPARLKSALAALDRGSKIPLLAGDRDIAAI